MTYFKSDITPKVGDKVSTGKFGECIVMAIVDGELECRNILTGEHGLFFSDDCDLIERKGHSDDNKYYPNTPTDIWILKSSKILTSYEPPCTTA